MVAARWTRGVGRAVTVSQLCSGPAIWGSDGHLLVGLPVGAAASATELSSPGAARAAASVAVRTKAREAHRRDVRDQFMKSPP
ncbi:hypothetical protein, partial [Frankia casuarinae]|uniref:hypothetical protein n=1 Tax=Frankia casuarinae (strain DSM 45818 / CECT 9043 / HFP020203 / CcI3) TaxID=106370 RepID=UPI001F6022A3